MILNQDKLKARAAELAANLVKDGMIVGLGTGSTVRYFLEALAKRVHSGELKNILGIPSSLQTEQISGDLGIPLTSYADYQELDITVDGADEVDPEFNLIKGGGGAFLREKVMAQTSKRFIIIIDESKFSDKLGTLFFVPVEVLPYALPLEMKYLTELGANVQIRKMGDENYYKTDQNNYVLDCQFGPIKDAIKLDEALNSRAGIMAHGLFLSMTDEVILASEKEVKHMKKHE